MKKLGSGSYGTVFHDPDSDTAIKRCFHEGSRHIWMGNLREIDILVRCGEHPNIVSIKDVTVEDEDEEFNKATLHMEYYETNLHHFMKKHRDSQIETEVVRKIMVQILLGLEYLHANKIIHRDLKPDNILINTDTYDVAICDFGMADINMKYQPAEKKVTSPMYRAPEVFLKKHYSYEIDSWAAGIIFYQMLYQEYPFEYPRKNIKDLENEVDDLTNKCEKEKNKTKRNKLIDQIEDKKLQIDNIIYNSISEGNIRKRFRSRQPYHNLLLNLLEIDPRKRCSIGQALENGFFIPVMEEYIAPTRKEFPPSPMVLNHISIEKIHERKWIDKYTSQFVSENKGLNCEILFPMVFHGIDLFERYLTFCRRHGSDLSKESLTKGKYLNEQETYLYLYTCFYIAHKYYSVTTYPFNFEDFFPRDIMSDSTMKKAEEFELFLLSTVIKYRIFNCTFYELEEEINNAPTERDYYRLLKNYLHTTQHLEKEVTYYTSYRAMQREHSFRDKN